MSKILFIDTETGGLDPHKHHLLTIGVCLWENGAIHYREEFPVWQSGYNLVCQDSALEINKIDLDEHMDIALDPAVVVNSLRIIAKMLTVGDKKPVVGGHNVQFDIGFLKAMFERCGEKWNDYFSHRTVDTKGVLQFLSVAGIYGDESTSLDSALQYYKIPVEGQRHSALADALATANLFSKLLNEFHRSLL